MKSMKRRGPGQAHSKQMSAKITALRTAAMSTAAMITGLALASPAWTADEIGNLKSVTIAAYGALPGEQETRLYVNDDVYTDQRIKTVSKATAEIRFIDDTELYLGPNSELVLDEFIFNPVDTAGEFAVELGEGLFRFVSGEMPSQSYTIDTPVAVIGVRGTNIVFSIGAFGLIMQIFDGAALISPKGGGAAATASTGQTASVASAASDVAVTNGPVSMPAEVSGEGGGPGVGPSIDSSQGQSNGNGDGGEGGG